MSLIDQKKLLLKLLFVFLMLAVVGSYAYFRRITENIIDELLQSVSVLIEQEDKEKYQEALERSRGANGRGDCQD